MIPLRLAELRDQVRGCHGCDLWRSATQAVFGEGPERARVMLIGEQPGDVEDKEGRPFVGPAGRLLDRALGAAGMDRRLVYLTNVVKHFKWEPRGKRRLHSKPNATEIRACLPWLERERELIQPGAIVCLGATAARALLGAAFRVSVRRGEWVSSGWSANLLATVHPSSILRVEDDDAREEAYQHFVADLKVVADRLTISPDA